MQYLKIDNFALTVCGLLQSVYENQACKILARKNRFARRQIYFASMATGETHIENFATSADCASTLQCLQQLGVEIFRENTTVFIKGVGKKGLQKSEKPLDCGNSGTTVRLISGILAGQNFDSVLIGDESLSKRPMRRIIEPLTQMGATIESNENCLPLRIYGKNSLHAISYDLPMASAQVKSCILLAGLNADGETSVIEPTLTRNHTEKMLNFLGANLEISDNRITVSGNAELTAKDLQIPSDISSAAFFLVAAACLKDSEIYIENVGLNPTRTAVLEVLINFGANIKISNKKEVSGEIIGDIRVKGHQNLIPKSNFNLLDGKIIANLIDEIPILAIFGTQIEGGLGIRGARELRFKESDRIASVVENLKRMNAKVEEFDDGFLVEKSNLKGATIDSFGDHRIAMAFAVAALFAEGETEIIGAESAAVSFPEFFQILENVKK
ncbi:MAG TPA: 3-phosphoshikimate 1-carboxyvinyltransferase [Pyrinomonadaceae bacterium]|nr:3-phosphoshikimate 1-carboxyvinyltransferase [Pyrinomonadaceae bacterium]